MTVAIASSLTEQAAPNPPTWRTALRLAAAVTALQVVGAFLVVGHGHVRHVSVGLCGWDGGWYRTIVDVGYLGPGAWPDLMPQGNVCFFPAYPLAVRLVQRLTGLSTTVSLLLTAQLACVGFWTYLLLLCRRWGIPSRLTAWGVALLAALPTSFFLIAAYSESLLLCAALGFVYWSEQSGPKAWILAALHGLVMTATRLVGAPLAIYPLVRALLRPRQPGEARQLLSAVVLTATASCGTLAFFAWCQVHFGHWDLYLRTQEINMGTHPRYLAVFSWELLRPSLPDPRQVIQNMFHANRVVASLMVWLFVCLFVVEGWLLWRGGSGWRERGALYLLALVAFYVPLSAFWAQGLVGMQRYALVPLALLGLVSLHLLVRSGFHRLPRCVTVPLFLWLLASCVWQAALLRYFLHGGAVA